MSWALHYKHSDPQLWQGRMDSPPGSCFFQVIHCLDLSKKVPAPTNQLSFGLIGFCCDEGIRRNLGRTGAAEGPAAIRKCLAGLPIPKQGINYFDAGNIVCSDQNLEMTQHALAEAVALLLQNNIIPIVLGGGHELAWGHYQGIQKKYIKEQLGIVNFDAHFDMRQLLPENKGSSGTPFLQIAEAHHIAKRRFDYNCIGIQPAGNTQHLFDTAKKYDTKILWADDLHRNDIDKCNHFIKHIIEHNQMIYLSLCLDVFASAYAPGVSAPQAFGLTPWQVLPLLRQLAASGKVISYDIAELSPKFDIDQRTAKLAANFIYDIIRHHKEH